MRNIADIRVVVALALLAGMTISAGILAPVLTQKSLGKCLRQHHLAGILLPADNISVGRFA